MAAVALLTGLTTTLALRPALVSRPPNLPAIARCPPPLLAASPPPRSPLLNPEVSLGVGVAILLLLVTNRLFTEDLLNSQSRADLIATAAGVVICLGALSNLDIEPRAAEPVALAGERVDWVDPAVAPERRRELAWAAAQLSAVEGCASVLVWDGARTVAARGLVRGGGGGDPGATVVAGPLVKLAVGRASGRPEYLRALQILPGRIEFSYLPEETQALLILPTAAGAGGGAVIVGADRQRAFGEDAVRRCAAIATEIVGVALT